MNLILGPVICDKCHETVSLIVKRITDSSICPHCKVITSYIYDHGDWFCYSCGALDQRKQNPEKRVFYWDFHREINQTNLFELSE